MKTTCPFLALAVLFIASSCTPSYSDPDTIDPLGSNTCRFAFDGECDETKYCPKGTDSADCQNMHSSNAGSEPTDLPPVVSYTVGALEVFVPEVSLRPETSEGFEIDSVSFSILNQREGVVGGWITNTTGRTSCFVKIEEAVCTTNTGEIISNCFFSYVAGTSHRISITGDTTHTCVRPQERAPFFASYTHPEETRGQAIVRVRLHIDADSVGYTPLSSHIDATDNTLVMGGSNRMGGHSFHIETTLVNTGNADALPGFSTHLNRSLSPAEIFVIDQNDHILFADYIEFLPEVVSLAPGESFTLETYRIRGLSIEDDFERVLVVPKWHEAL